MNGPIKDPRPGEALQLQERKGEPIEIDQEDDVRAEAPAPRDQRPHTLLIKKEGGGGKPAIADTTSFRNLTRLGFSFEEATLVAHVARMEEEGLCEAGLTANHVLQSCSIEAMRRQGLDDHLADKMQLALGMPRRGAAAAATELMSGRWPWRLIATLMIGTSGTEISLGLFYVRGFGELMEWLLAGSKSIPLPEDMADFYSQFVSNNFLGNCGDISDKMIAFSKKTGLFAAAQVNGWLEGVAGIPAMVLPLQRAISKESVDMLSTFLLTARFTTSPIEVEYEDFYGNRKKRQAYGIITFMEPEDLQAETGLPVHGRARQSDEAVGNSGAPLAGMQDENWECPNLLIAFPSAQVVMHINGGGQANGHALTRSKDISVGNDFGPCAGLINQVAELTIGNFYDPNGENAARGRIIPEFFTRILRKYLELGQKKAGNEGIKEFVKNRTEEYMLLAGEDLQARVDMGRDLLATVTEAVAVILIARVNQEIVQKTGVPEVVEFSGGAWWNKHLTARFQYYWMLAFGAALKDKAMHWTTFEKMHPGTGCRNDSKEDLLLAQLAQMASAGRGFISVATGGGFVIPGTMF